MIKLLELLNKTLNQQQIIDIAKEFMSSSNYNKSHDCKRSTYEFINWLKKNKKFEPEVLLLAPPKDIKKYPGKSGTGDSHIFAIIDGYGVDFTANQFPGISEPLKITLEDKISTEYKKIGGYYTLYPDWFPEETNGGKSFIKTKWNNLPQWFRDGFEKEGFKPDLNESIDKIAGVWDTDEKFKDGSDFKIKFKVSNIIDLAKNTPVKEIDPKSIKYNFSGRQDSDPSKTKERVMKADLSYPIIAVKNEAGKIFAMLDGTHRLEKALNLGLDKIKTKILDKEDLIQFKTDILKEKDEAVDVECEKCGRTWNTADSDPNDKYICHKCGFDNSYRYANKANNDDIDEYDVENEQDLKEFITFIKEYTQMLNEADCGCVTEAEYRGRKVTLGKPMQGDIKKFKVYVKNDKGKVVKVNFGFGGSSAKGKRMNIKVNNPKRRAAYRARHHCDKPGPRWKANYWSCKKW